jgi:hypothetical protein
MRRTLVLLATMMLVVVASSSLAVAASSLNNGNFESGDLTGWSVDTPASGGGASAVTGYDYYAQITCEPGWQWGPCYSLYTMPPWEGSYFALLQHARTSGDSQTWNTKISQPFEASNGDKVSGWAFFQTDFSGSLDKGQVVITNLDSGTPVATPFEKSDDYGGPKVWTYWEHTFAGVTGTGTFQIEVRLQNIADYAYPGQSSAMGLDNVKTTTASNDDTTKPSTSATRSVEPNTAGWNKANVTVTLNATDNQGGSGVQKITYSASGAQTIAQTDAPGNSVEVALDQEGTTTLTYYATDKAANVEDQKTLTLKIDKSAPTGTVFINDGASRTCSRSVTLTLSATDPSAGGSGVSQMRISNTQSGLSSASWEAYSTTKAWTLSSGQGTKTVYVRYRDGAGNESTVVTDTIRYSP